MPRVFVICPGPHSYDAAARFGEVVLLFKERYNPFQTDRLLQLAKKTLLEEQQATSHDFLVLCANPVLNAIVIALWQKQFDQFNLLVYGAKERDYTPRTIKVF